MPRDIRMLDYIYIDIQLFFEKVDGPADEKLDLLYSKAAKELL